MIPTKLVLENFVSHIYSVLDFTKFDVALIMGSFEGDPNIANGVGKSSIMDGIRFALYGKGKFSTKTKMIRRGSEFCQVEFEFIVDEELYRIIRRLSAQSGTMSLELSKKVGNKWKTSGWTCDTPTKTNQKIFDIIGMNHDTFVNIVYFRQNDVSGFTSATASKRKEILKEALQIGIWDEFQKVSKDTEKALKSKLMVINDRLKILGNVSDAIKKIDKDIKEKDKEIKKLQEEISKGEEIQGEIGDEISNIKSNIVKNSTLDRDSIESEIRSIHRRAKEIVKRKDILKKEKEKNDIETHDIDKSCKDINNALISHYNNVLISFHKRRGEVEKKYKLATKKDIPNQLYSEDDFNSIKNKHLSCMENTRAIESDLLKLNTLKPGEECPTCLCKINNLKDVEKRRKSRQKFLENRLVEMKALLGEVNRELEKIEKVISNANNAIFEIDRNSFILSKKEMRLREIENDNEKNALELKQLKSEWNNLKDRKSVLENLLEKKETKEEKNLKSLIVARRNVVNKTDNYKEELMKLSVSMGNLEGFREELKRKDSEVQALIKEKNSITSNIIVYSKLSTAFGKDGIQAIIMENITEDLRQYANSILRNIYYKPISVDFVTQRQTSTGTWREDFDIIINIDNELYDFEDISGGEQVRISIALRLALSQLLMRRVGSNVKFLLFDEVDQSLDRHGLEALADTITELSKEFKTLVISHSEYMKERFEHIINVHMGPAGSVLR